MAKLASVTEQTVGLSDWELFWRAYPKKKARLDAQKAWRQTAKIRPGIEELLGAVHKMSELSTDKEFIPYPATWLRRGQWLDE